MDLSPRERRIAIVWAGFALATIAAALGGRWFAPAILEAGARADPASAAAREAILDARRAARSAPASDSQSPKERGTAP